jgi:stage V sporulation protein SpoVS
VEDVATNTAQQAIAHAQAPRAGFKEEDHAELTVLPAFIAVHPRPKILTLQTSSVQADESIGHAGAT